MNEIKSSTEQGLLDLTVELSTSDIIAGKQFTLFVAIKNPFSKPVWIRDIDVMLPSDLIKVIDTEQIEAVKKQITKINQKQVEQAKDAPWNSIEITGESSVGLITVTSDKKVKFSTSDNARIGTIELYDPSHYDIAKSGALKLKTSLPSDNPLQCGSTMVATAQLNVKNSVFFTPAKYRLQFTVNYTFDNPYKKALDESDSILVREQVERYNSMNVFSNTVSHPLQIRPSVGSMIVGATIGGLVGSVTRLLKVTPSLKQLSPDHLIAIIVAVSLSAIAVVFVARKSDNQSFITVEDFWGGLLIGFLVGYTGTSFFETITGYNENGRISK